MATGSELPPVMSWGGFSTRQTELAAEAVGKTSPRLLQRRRSSSMPPGSVAAWVLVAADGRVLASSANASSKATMSLLDGAIDRRSLGESLEAGCLLRRL